MRKNKAFTLIELLVAISVSTILLALLASTFYYFSVSSQSSIMVSSTYYSLRRVKDYIIEKQITESTLLDYTDSCLYYDSAIVIDDLTFDSLTFEFTNSDNVHTCNINYQVDNKESNINFVVYIGGS